MFGSMAVDELDLQQCAQALHDAVVERRHVGARLLAVAAHFSDLSASPTDTEAVGPSCRARGRGKDRGGDRAIRIGADGTPLVSEFSAVEMGMLLQTTTGSARATQRDALELRHRFPRLWAAVMACEVDDWVARKVVTAARALTLDQARWVDEQVVEALIGLPFGRAMQIVQAKVIAADPDGYEARRREAESRRYVSLSRRDPENGTATLFARGLAGDLTRLMALVRHLATQLALHGDTSSSDERCAKAFGLLANPALVCVLLARAQDANARRLAQPDPAAPAAPADDDASGEEPDSEERSGEELGAAVVAREPLFDLPRADGTAGCPPADSPPANKPPDDSRPAPEEEPVEPTVVDLAVEMGRLLDHYGSRVLDRLRPRTVLYVHLDEAALREAHPPPTPDRPLPEPGPPTGTQVARLEDVGPVGLPELRQLLGHDRITVRPVAYPRAQAALDDYQLSRPLREAVTLLHPFEVFPYGTLPSRHTDKDHTEPYEHQERGAAEPDRRGQTQLDNLGPLGRTHHRAKTHGDFTCHQPLRGVYYWRTPTGHWYRVNHHGTRYRGTRIPRVITEVGNPVECGLSPLELHFSRTIADHSS